MTTTTIDKYRVGRNYIRRGDMVRVKPSKPKKQDGGPAKLQEIHVDEVGNVSFLKVMHEGRVRWYKPDRIERMAQTRHGEKRVVLR